MDIQITEIPAQVDRLSSTVRFFETQYKSEKQTRQENRAVNCILSDTAITNFTLWTTGLYEFDTFVEYGWFTVSGWEVTIPKDWVYYIGYMINIYQIHVWDVEFKLLDLKSNSQVSWSGGNYWYATLWSSAMVSLTKGQKISITYTIWSSTWYSPAEVYTVWDYTQNKLFIFEMPTLSIN